MNIILTLFIPVMFIASSAFSEPTAYDSFAQLQQTCNRLHHEMVALYECWQKTVDSIDYDTNNSWFSLIRKQENAIQLIFENINTNIVDATCNDNQELVITIDAGSIHITTTNDVLRVTIRYEQQDVENDDSNTVVQQSTVNNVIAYDILLQDALQPLDQADIQYDKANSKQLIITLNKKVASLKKIPVTIL